MSDAVEGPTPEEARAFAEDLTEDKAERLFSEADYLRRPWFAVVLLEGSKKTGGHLHANSMAAANCMVQQMPSLDPEKGLVVKFGGPGSHNSK